MNTQQKMLRIAALLVLSVMLAGMIVVQVSAIAISVEERGENYVWLEVSDINLTSNSYYLNGIIALENYSSGTVIFQSLESSTPYIISACNNTIDDCATEVVVTKEIFVSSTFPLLFFLSLIMMAIGTRYNVFNLPAFILGILSLFRLLTQTTETWLLLAVGLYCVFVLYVYGKKRSEI